MVQVLPEVQTFGSRLGRGLGEGISQGFSQRTALNQQISLEKAKQQQKVDTFQKLIGSLSPPQASAQSKLRGMQEGPGQAELSQTEGIQRDAEDSMWKHLAPEQRAAVSLLYPELGRGMREEEKMAQKKKSEIAARHFEISKDTLKNVASKAESMPLKKLALDSMKDAIKEGNLGFFSKDNLAEVTGVEGFRSPEGALFKTAGKEFFIGNLGRVGGKGLNQWLERQISDMMPKIGRSTEANLIVTEALTADMDVEKKQIDLTNQIADQMEKKYGFVPRDLAARVQKQIAPYAVEKQKELKSKIESIKEQYEPSNKEGQLMYDPSGNLRRVPKNQIRDAKSAGYRVSQ